MRVGYGISGTNILSIGRGVSVGGGGGFVGPYDAVPSITAAYGMRRLLSSYTGPILRLRRDFDNTEQDIGYVANGDLDTAALASWLGEANGYITTWYDQSGNGHHATQSTAASQPLYVAGGQNGRPVLRFDGSAAQGLSISGMPASPAISVFAAANFDPQDGDPSRGTIYDVQPNANGSIYYTGSNQFDLRSVTGTGYWSGSHSHNLGVAQTQHVVWSVRGTAQPGGVERASINGVEIVNQARGTSATTGTTRTIGTDSSVWHHTGDIGELVECSDALSDNDTSAVEAIINDYWSLF